MTGKSPWKTGSRFSTKLTMNLKGKASNYIYGSAKAGFTVFLSGLRNRLAKKKVHVLTVLPGTVYTKMTLGMKLPKFFTSSPEKVANDV